MRSLLLLAVAGLINLTAADIAVTEAWSRATAASAANGVVYATIANTGAADDRLLAVASPAADRVELHTVVTEGAAKRMTPVADVPVPAKGSAVLKPGSYHIMLLGLKAPLVEGQTIAVTMTFATAGAVPVTVKIAGAAATESPDCADDCCAPAK